MADWPQTLAPGPKTVISTFSVECAFYGINWLLGGASNITTAWTTANVGLIIPFTLAKPFLCAQIMWENGATVSGNIEVSWWDATLSNKLVTTGSTAQSGTSTVQVVNVTDTTIPVGDSFVVFIIDNTTGLVRTSSSNTRALMMAGVRQFSGAVPTTTITPADPATALMPVVAFSSKSVF